MYISMYNYPGEKQKQMNAQQNGVYIVVHTCVLERIFRHQSYQIPIYFTV